MTNFLLSLDQKVFENVKFRRLLIPNFFLIPNLIEFLFPKTPKPEFMKKQKCQNRPEKLLNCMRSIVFFSVFMDYFI